MTRKVVLRVTAAGYPDSMEGSSPKTPGSTEADVRCSSCGALVSVDAEWCGQCFTPLKVAQASREELAAKVGIKVTEEPPSDPTLESDGSVARPTTTGRKPRLSWPCPACEHENDIQLNLCEICGTSFASLMKTDDEPVSVEPKDALIRSLIYPGLGHRLAGRGADGVARGALFTLSAILLLMVALSGLGSAGQSAMVALYLTTTLIIYVGSAAEAYRIAGGGAPFVSARTLLWVTVGLLLVSIGLLALAATVLVRR